MGYDQSFGDLSASITYFTADLEDEITTNFSFDPVTFAFLASPDNLAGESERAGIEGSVNYQFSDAISLAGFGTYIRSENNLGVDEIRIPEFTASVSANWESQTKDGFRAGFAVDYVGDQLDTCLLYTSPSPRDGLLSRMPSSA